jgi:hypothetical protein
MDSNERPYSREEVCDCEEEPKPCYWPWLCCCLALAILLLLLIFLLPVPDRLVLADNTTQPLIDGNWSDVYYDRNLLTSARWSHAEQPVGPNAEITSLVAGLYHLYIAIHPQLAPEMFSVSSCGVCPCAGASCAVTADCCDPFTTPPGEASFCNPNTLTCAQCPNTGAACVDDNDCCPSYAGTNVSTYCFMGQCRACRETGESCNIFDGSAICCTEVGAFCQLPASVCAPPPPTLPPPPPDAPCGVCPCDGQVCYNQSDCCDPYYFPGGQSSVCYPIDADNNSQCFTCGFRSEGDLCNFDFECDCNGTALVCLAQPPFGFTFCLPPTAAPTPAPTPPYGPACVNQSQCTDTQYCSPALNLCVTCAYIHEPCTQDPDYQCNCSGSNATNGLFCSNETNQCEALCANVSECPADNYCLGGRCYTCFDPEGPICCNTSEDCLLSFGADSYCSPNYGVCVACAHDNDSCSLDPSYQCGCNASDNLFCDPDTLLCAPVAPTAAPTVAPVCPPSPTLYARLMRQRAPNPNFVPVGAPFVPVVSGAMYLVATAVTTEAGDVLKVQWTSPDCPFMALTPVSFDLALIGVPNLGVQAISAYFVATTA